MNEKPWLVVNQVYKDFDQGKIKALRGVNLSVKKGEFVALEGPSGSGKSTLLHLIGGLEQPNQGEIRVGNFIVSEGKNLDHYRRQTVGFIFQLHNLLAHLNALENVLIPTIGSKTPLSQRRERARQLLIRVGLEKRLHYRPPQLSGGERQRVAVARAFINQPQLILADEPTGALDTQNSAAVLQLLKELQQEARTTIILVSHNPAVTAAAERKIKIIDGRIIEG